MLLPSKVTSYNNSIFPNAILILSQLQKSDYSVLALYYECKDKISDIATFISILNLLYAVGKIDLTIKGDLHYVA